MQIVLSRDRDDRKTDVYVETLRLAFEGRTYEGGSPSAYLADAVDLGIRVLEPLAEIEDAEIRALVSGARNTVVVRIGGTSPTSKRLSEIVGQERVVAVEATSAAAGRATQAERADGEEEEAFAPVVATLRAMERARQLLAADVATARNEEPSGAPTLFISHAKTDGLAMARSLIGVLRQLSKTQGGAPGFDYFYDGEHIEPGAVWQRVLDAKARASVLIALRTEAYESRYWCRREFLLAESSGMPILAVDLRKEQYHGSAQLPFDAVPSVRVHDGNLIRVVLHAIGAHLRALRVQSRVAADVKVLPHRPSVYSLAGAGEAETAYDKIAHPAPRVTDKYNEAAQAILRSGKGAAKLVTFDELE